MSSTPIVRAVSDRVLLADGRGVTIRPLRPGDAAALLSAVEHEDPWDLRRRFMGTPPPPAMLVRQLSRADGFHDLAIGAFADDGRLVGVAQFDRTDDGPAAEVAIEVSHDWQRLHLGTVLLTTLVEFARERGVREFTATYYGDNVAIRRLLYSIGYAVESGIDHGAGYARIHLDMPAPARDKRTLTECLAAS